MIDKKSLTEAEIRTRYITPALFQAGWDAGRIGEERYITADQIRIAGKKAARRPNTAKRADYVLERSHGVPLAVIEAKDNKHSVRDGIQQALKYAEMLDVPFAFSSNGDGFVFHDKTATEGAIETEFGLDSFPSPEELWQKYCQHRDLTTELEIQTAGQQYYDYGDGMTPRYYQQIAINRTVEAIAKGEKRILLVMATGTGKTYTAFQIVHRLWTTGLKTRILYLADRNVLIDQPMNDDFKFFKAGSKMMRIRRDDIDKSKEIYFALYQGVTSGDPEADCYKEFSPNFFDFVIIDECHRGSAEENSAWRRVLEYFTGATHLGLTATPKETCTVSNAEYFGEPIYTYSLKQGIEDGFLAPYKVIRFGLNVDLEGWRPEDGKRDIHGEPVEDRVYNLKDFDRNLVIDERTKEVASRVTEFLKGTDRRAKTIVFCVDIDHAARMRQALINANADLVREGDDEKKPYIAQITSGEKEGIQLLDHFKSVGDNYPTIVTTSKLLTTGVNTKTTKVIVLDSNIRSMTEFKQIIGRGTRVVEESEKLFFTILDFRNVTDLFADSAFDGNPGRPPVIVPPDQPIPPDDPTDDETDDEPTECPEPDGEPDDDPERPVIDGDPATPDTVSPLPTAPREKIYVNGVDVTLLNRRIQILNPQGKLITVDLRDYTRSVVRQRYDSLDEFLTRWKAAEQKTAIIEELRSLGVPFEELEESVKRTGLDPFDLICYIAYGRPPLTRKERADQVKKRDCFTKYGDTARNVIALLLDKYAEFGIDNIENMEVLTINPFVEIGSLKEIVALFGGRDEYLEAVHEIERQLYQNP